MRACMRLHCLVVATGMAMSVAAPARAETEGTPGQRLAALAQEAAQLAQGIQPPDIAGQSSVDQANRRLIDAQVAFGMGNHADAAVLLYDYVARYPDSRSYDVALYYLAEALFQKGDHIASRTYFTKLARDIGPASKLYQQALERLVELALVLHDTSGVDEWLRALDQVPPDQLRPSVPYVRGKYAYAAAQYDQAIGHFASVPPGSAYDLQARYFLGVCHVARGALDEAMAAFTAVVARDPRTSPQPTAPSADETRVIELAHMALGRIYYERDQPGEAIAQYLEVDRKSPLFAEALYEMAWVYIKARQLARALYALELLALSDPTSPRTPSVKILEGNLRIRKAKALDLTDPVRSAEEYAKAQNLFAWTQTSFDSAHDELARVMAEHADPRVFMAQITGRMSAAFDIHATLPEIAAAWAREEPEVARLVDIETDLGTIADYIADAEHAIARLDQALAAPARADVFPRLAQKRTRAGEILGEVLAIRRTLSVRALSLVRGHAEEDEGEQLEALAEQRERIARALATLPGAGISPQERRQQAQRAYAALDQRTAEVARALDSAQATLVAVDMYARGQTADDASDETNAPATDQGTKQTTGEVIEALRGELEALRGELEAVRREAVLARDAAGSGDPVAVRARDLRARLRQALDQEEALFTRILGRMEGEDSRAAEGLVTQMRAAGAVTATVDEIEHTIDEIVAVALVDVRAALVEEKARLAEYEREFAMYEQASRTLGGPILSTALAKVKDALADVLARADIGFIDVAWSQKEDIDHGVQKLDLLRVRELRTLEDDFRDFLEDGEESAPKRPRNSPSDSASDSPPTEGRP